MKHLKNTKIFFLGLRAFSTLKTRSNLSTRQAVRHGLAVQGTANQATVLTKTIASNRQLVWVESWLENLLTRQERKGVKRITITPKKVKELRDRIAGPALSGARFIASIVGGSQGIGREEFLRDYISRNTCKMIVLDKANTSKLMERNKAVWTILAQKEGLDPQGKEVRSRWIKLLKESKTNPKTKSFVASIYEICRTKPEYSHLFLSRFQIEERERRAAERRADRSKKARETKPAKAKEKAMADAKKAEARKIKNFETADAFIAKTRQEIAARKR